MSNKVSISTVIIAISFILIFSIIIQTEIIVRDMEYSEASIPLWKGEWRDLPERFRVYMKIQGKISREESPVPWFGPAPPVRARNLENSVFCRVAFSLELHRHR